MKAAVVRAFGESLVIEKRHDPGPDPDQARIREHGTDLLKTADWTGNA
ncbi:hypothetical protein PYK79_34700 [Streptomyces sp. ID05-04B]|nr:MULTISPECIES: hypothetical protein [unclassified Streptomyces]MDX5567411.1 hypothetical protein [Streptomyces sp. ID05-04B]